MYGFQPLEEISCPLDLSSLVRSILMLAMLAANAASRYVAVWLAYAVRSLSAFSTRTRK